MDMFPDNCRFRVAFLLFYFFITVNAGQSTGKITIQVSQFFSSPEPSGSQGELIVYPCSVVRPSSVRRPSSTIFKDLLL